MDLLGLKQSLARFRSSPEFGVFQLNEYVHAFRGSSDRARYVIFIITAVSLLTLIAAWNYHGLSWSRRAADNYHDQRARDRAEEWKKFTLEERRLQIGRQRIDRLLTLLESAPQDAVVVAQLQRAVLDAERLQRAEPLREFLAMKWKWAAWDQREHDLEWYGGQTAEFYGRGVFVPVPGLGASVHVNDMALLGGLVLLALTGLLWISLIRQHENLYLALFKIGQIRQMEEDPRDGDSVSNLMYHTLAMAQVLSHPPTLARWNLRIRHRIVHTFGSVTVYFLPVVVHAGLVLQNIRTRERAYPVWGVEMTHVRLGFQVLFAIGILTFCALAFIYAQSCERRWRKAFFSINPGLQRIEQRPWSEWVGLSDGNIPSKDMRRLARDLTYTLEVTPRRSAETRKDRSGLRIRKKLDMRQHGVTLRGTWQCFIGLFRRGTRLVITQREMTKAVNELFDQCAGPDQDPDTTRIRNIRVEENQITTKGNRVKFWKVAIKADVQYPPKE